MGKKKKNWRILHREAGAIWFLKRKKGKKERKHPARARFCEERLKREREREEEVSGLRRAREIAGTCEPCDLNRWPRAREQYEVRIVALILRKLSQPVNIIIVIVVIIDYYPVVAVGSGGGDVERCPG